MRRSWLRMRISASQRGSETTTASGCSGYLKTHYKCVYHRAQSAEDVCFGVNPPAYAVGATLTTEDVSAASCPNAAYPTNTTLMLDVVAPFYGTAKPSNLDRCM